MIQNMPTLKEPGWLTTVHLRFVFRDGRHILQQMHIKIGTEPALREWRDVPLEIA